MNRPILPDRWEKLAPLLDAALDHAVDERAAFLNEVCRDDPSLKAELTRLVKECDRPAPLLDHGVLESLPSLAEETPSLVSTTIAGRYRIDAEIGAGGMATVYLAHDLRHDRNVAVKVFSRALGARLGAERFLAEVRITAALQHPNILPIYDSGEFEGGLYYVMPFVDGESLRHRLAKGELTVDAAVAILRDIARALAYAHGRGVLHRDIKPDNILLSAHGALVADFGIAEMIGASRDDAERNGLAGIAAGTPAYMSPEQAMGRPKIDHRADIYAFGVVAYEMLAGRTPFMGGDTRQLLAAHVNQTPVPVVEYSALVPPALAELVMRCLAKNPAHRPQSAEEVAQAIDVALAATSRATAPRRRGRAGAVIGASILALLVAATVVIALLRDRAPTLNPRGIVVAPFTNLTNDPTLDVLGPMIAQGITSALEPLDSIEVVGSVAALLDLRNDSRLPNARRGLRELGADTHASRVVWGSYARHGDTLRVHAEIVSASDDRVVYPVDLVAGLISSPNEAIGRVGEAVAVAVDAALARRSIGTLGRIPTIGAYAEFWDGWKISSDDSTALPHYEEAIRLDSTFILAYYQAATVLWNLGRFRALDSLVQSLEPRRNRFSPVERDLFEDMEAFSRHDWERELRATRSLLRRDSTAYYVYLVGFMACRTNRPNEALATLRHYSGQRPFSVWLMSAAMHHVLGQYDAELARSTSDTMRGPAGRVGQVPRLLRHASALAALGRLTELRTLVDSAVASWSPRSPIARPNDPVGSGVPGAWYVAIAQELRAHGRTDEARAYVALGLAWNSTHIDGEANRDRRAALGDLLLMAGLVDSARTVWQRLVADSTMGTRALGNLGIISAIAGDTARAGDILRALASAGAVPHSIGRPQFAAAGVAAWLGKKADAVQLLNDAQKAGAPFDVSWHAIYALEPLWDFPAFKEFLRPKG